MVYRTSPFSMTLNKPKLTFHFFERFGPPCRNPLADLDSSIPECAQVCALHTELHLATLRKTEMLAVLCTNKTTPIFWGFNSPPPAPRADGPQRGRGHIGRNCPYKSKIWCGCVHALLRDRSKTAKMQKFPFNSHSNENFISPFFRSPGAANPQKGRTHSEPEYARMENLAWIGPRVVEKSLTEQTKVEKTYSKTSASVELTQTRHSHLT